ncbi:MAG: hypothetical protein ACRD5H_11415 [Nitrososphaerales archaeon]
MLTNTSKRLRNKILKNSKTIAAIAVISAMLTAAFAIQPVLAQAFQDKQKTPNYIRATANPNNTCVTSVDDTKCAFAYTSGIAELKIVENTLGTWQVKSHHEMNPSVPFSPSSGFYITVDSGCCWAEFRTYLDGKVYIEKNGKTVKARYGGIICDADGSNLWVCTRYFAAEKSTSGTHTIPAGTSVYVQIPVPSPPLANKYTMGSWFECYTTGTGGTVIHTKCDAYTGDRYFKATKLRVSWPWL